MRVVLLVDDAVFRTGDPNFAAQRWPKYLAAEFSVSHALRKLGHVVIGVPAKADLAETIRSITAAEPDIVFNMVEEIGGDRRFDSVIVQILELMRIRFTGASSDALGLCRNKQLAKLVVANAGVQVPKGFMVKKDLKYAVGRLTFPMIVKPAFTDGSDGIDLRSYVTSAKQFRQRLPEFRRWLPVLCEEYIPGREIIVTMSGTKTASIDSICEMTFPEKSPVKFASDRAKFDAGYRKRYGIRYRTPSKLDGPLKSKVMDAAKKAYSALQINAYAKLEFRVSDERVVFIEANPNSQLNRLAKSTDFAAIGYERFIKKIIRMSLSRIR